MLQSMTGFSRVTATHQGVNGETRFVWEIRSVNGKGLDVRLRLPHGLDAVEHQARAIIGKYFSRGSFQASLTIENKTEDEQLIINEAFVEKLMSVGEKLKDKYGLKSARLDGILSIRGVIEPANSSTDDKEQLAFQQSLLKGFEEALAAIKSARQEEGAALSLLLNNQLVQIENLCQAARRDTSRSVEAIKARLSSQIALLLEASNKALDEDRLHVEAAFLATKADIQEELDRLDTHIYAARSLIAAGGPVGRKLDFLCQEFNREANTLCSKSNAASVTAIGLDMKAFIDQFREQVQNLE